MTLDMADPHGMRIKEFYYVNDVDGVPRLVAHGRDRHGRTWHIRVKCEPAELSPEEYAMSSEKPNRRG